MVIYCDSVIFSEVVIGAVFTFENNLLFLF